MLNMPAVIVAILVSASVGGTPLVRTGQPSTPPHSACDSAAGPVKEERFVRIGGIEQWITITGASCANPVILFLHGGPGNTLTPYADKLFASWEQRFTLVQWDQRGAGRTYQRSPPAPGEALTIERMRDDGLAVAQYLIDTLGQRKIILVGGSWGSILGIHMVKAKPELFEAYVGFAQVVSYAANQPASYAKVLAAARAAGDQGTVSALTAMGVPPWTDPRNYGILRRATRSYEAKTTDAAPAAWWVRSPEYDSAERRDSYVEGEDYSYLQFVGMQGNGMFARIDLPALGLDFNVPVFIVQGAEDLVTVAEVAREYFDRISAPRKGFVLVPRAGHDPNAAMLDALHKVLAPLRRK